MFLAELKDVVSKFGDAISKILDVDVLIVDNNLNRVGNTYRYSDEPVPIRQMSIIGQVITSGQVIAIDDKNTYHTCKVCPDLSECNMNGFIGVPIFYKERVVGAIALILPERKIQEAFRDVRNSIEFLERMADLLSSKIQNSDDYKHLNTIKREREILMDSIEDAIVSTDEIGYITYYNIKFVNFFGPQKNCTGMFIKEVISHRVIDEFLSTPNDVTNQLIYIESEGHPFYGFLSCMNISVNGHRTGMLFSFKALSSVNAEFNKISHDNLLVTFNWAEQGFLSSGTIDLAKRISIKNKTVLIYGENGSGKEMLAKAIHNFSNRSQNGFIIVDCGGLNREFLEQSIFGDERDSNVLGGLGKLQLAHKGTIYFHKINKMPMYLQKRIVEFLKTNTIRQAFVRDIQIDVRLIFSTDQELSALAKQGLFDDELYYRISEDTIEIPPLRKDKRSMSNILQKNIAFYKQKYNKEHLIFGDDVMAVLSAYSWPSNMKEIECTIDSLVCHCSEQVCIEDLLPYHLMEEATSSIQSIRELEKEKISQLLATAKSKDEVARLLNIGRATLYRKIKQYNINL